MPRPGTIPADIADFLKGRQSGATVGDIADALGKVRRSPVRRPSVRSAIYQHLDAKGDRMFERVGRGRYGLQKSR